VLWERKGLAAGGLEAGQKALFEERVAQAKKFDDFLAEYASFPVDTRKARLSMLADTPSYGFLSELIAIHAREESDEMQVAIEAAFAAAPNQATMALEDAIQSGDGRRAARGFRIAARCGLGDLVAPGLEAFRHVTEPGEVEAFAQDLVAISGADAGLALLAKLERGDKRCFEWLTQLLEGRPDEAGEAAAIAVWSALETKGAVAVGEREREALRTAARPSEEQVAAEAAEAKKVARAKRLKELEEELGASGVRKKSKGGDDEG
jgi:hypothetical protein